MLETQRNWAGNYTYSATRLHHPETIEHIQELVRKAHKLKVLGSRHSFNHIADSVEDLIALDHFDQVGTIDHERRTITVAGGVRYGQLCQQLHREGFALPNLASLPHISVAGASATATHGSGNYNRSMATVVSALELVTADGTRVTLSREQQADQLHGAIVSLGGLGVITQLTLDLIPTFEVRQDVYEYLPMTQLEKHFDAITSSAYSVSLFTNWRGALIDQVWLKRRVADGSPAEAEPEFFGATLATRPLHPIRALSAVNCTEQMGIPGAWYERLPHFRMEFTPSSGEELQSEYLIPRSHAIDAIHALAGLGDTLAPLLQISEVRTIAADDLWLSPFYQQDCIGIHLTWHQNWPAVKQLLPLVEAKLAPFDARPHWGKLFTMPAAHLRSLYKKLPDFQRLLSAYDPDGKFRNAFLDTYIFGDA